MHTSCNLSLKQTPHYSSKCVGRSSGLNLQELKCEVVSKRHGALWSQMEVGKPEMQQKQRWGENVLKGALLDLMHLSHNQEP